MVDLFADEAPLVEEEFFEEDEELENEDITPRSNPGFAGHEKIEQQLLKDYQTGRLPHALILAGADGIGKATLAYRLARFLLSQEQDVGGLFGEEIAPESLYVAPEHAVFKRVVSSGHADLLVVEREFDEKRGRYKNEISVEAVRRIHPFLQKTSAEGGWRIVIVDGAQALNRSSQNALLKVLEEPPKNTMLILTTSKPGAFLPTIRSRCRTIPMQPLKDEEMDSLFEMLAPSIGTEERDLLKGISAGSIGKALEFYNENGVDIYSQSLELLQTMPNLDMVKLHELAEKFGRFGSDRGYYTLVDIITRWCEQQARAAARGQSAPDVLGSGEVLGRLASAYPKGHFLDAWEKITTLVQQVDSHNLDKRQGVIGAFLAIQDPKYSGLDL